MTARLALFDRRGWGSVRPMSKTATLVTVLTATLAATACSSKKDAPKAKPAPEVKPPAPEVKPPAPPAPPVAVTEVKDVGLATPESVLPLPDQDVYLVSNINGAPTALDDNGFISKLGPDGKIVELKWIDGSKPDITLNAPKGMAVLGGNLYVADVTAVRIFDLATGAAKGAVDIKGATFLNDVAAGADTIYVTDSGLTGELKPSGTDAVYAIDAAGAVTKLAAGADLKGPNGVTVIDGNVWAVPFGGKEAYRIADGKPTDLSALPTGGLDGIEAVGDGRVVISSWEGKAVYIGKLGGPFTALAEGVESPADLGIDHKRQRVVVPLFMSSTVRFIAIP